VRRLPRHRSWLAVLLVALGGGANAVEAEQPFPGGAAAYFVEVQGKPIWSRRAERALPPASLTKIMTALLFLESGLPLEGLATVSATAQRATGSRLGLRAGEQLRAGDLLAATLLKSANDACLALAEHVGGTEQRFAAAMNRRALELELGSTHFTNACGHDEPEHHSSARDLAELTKIAMRQSVFADLVRSVERRVGTLGGRSWELQNTNELVGRYPGASGVKSGFTPRAGKCLVALAEREGVSVLLVVLNAPNRWWDSVAMLDRAFAQARSGAVPHN
jgi:D-alanyl-D-alanine carboxypeptidase (penicillin-binding protein 5/6)